jgi:hypothetical protein
MTPTAPSPLDRYWFRMKYASTVFSDLIEGVRYSMHVSQFSFPLVPISGGSSEPATEDWLWEVKQVS